jgi:hypothetical protein
MQRDELPLAAVFLERLFGCLGIAGHITAFTLSDAII